MGFRWEFQGTQPMRCRFREWEASEFGDRNLASVEIAGKDGSPLLFTIRVPTVLAKQLGNIGEGDDITILWKGKKPGRMGEYHDFATYNHDAKSDDSLPPGLQGEDETYEAWLEREIADIEGA